MRKKKRGRASALCSCSAPYRGSHPPLTPPPPSLPFLPPGGHDYINLQKEEYNPELLPHPEQHQPRKAALPNPDPSGPSTATSTATSAPAHAPGSKPPTLPPRSADSIRKASVLRDTMRRTPATAAAAAASPPSAGGGTYARPNVQGYDSLNSATRGTSADAAATSTGGYASPNVAPTSGTYAAPNVAPTSAGYATPKGAAMDDAVAYATPTPQPTPDALQRFQIPAERLQIVSELGAGQFGQVFEAWLQGAGEAGNGKLVAVKTCKAVDDAKTRQNFLMEAQTLAKFSHPNVLGLIGISTTRLPWQIIVEHVVHGDLRAVLKSCRTNSIEVKLYEKLFMAAQVAAGMAHLAALKFVHRDLAARNVLLGRYCNVKIADFGLSRQLGSESEYYVVQTRCLLPIRWMSPEALNYRKFTTASDAWAFGVVLWEILSQAKTPWRKHSTQEVTDRVTAGERLPSPRDCPSYVYEMMLECWNAAPAKRPSFPALQQRLEDMCEQVRAGVGGGGGGGEERRGRGK